MALRFKAAKRGGYQAKKDFVEYFYCNGPELDTDTILYYREKCYQDPVYIQIAEIEFSDITIVDNLREQKYGKSNDLNDCFTKPCNYLGPLSSSIGMMTDSNNFRTFPNLFSTLLKGKQEDWDNLGCIWGNIRQHLTNKIMPDVRIACQMLYDNMYNHAKDFAKECQKAGITDSADIGDPLSIARAEDVATTARVNLYNQLGDCARLWEHMRRFNPYDPTQNKKGPIPEHALKDNKSTNGAAMDKTKAPAPTTQVPPKKIKEAAAQGNKEAQWQEELQKMPIGVTMEDWKYMSDVTKSEKDRLEYGKKLFEKADAVDEAQMAYRNKYEGNREAIDALDNKNVESDKMWQKVRNMMTLLQGLCNESAHLEENLTEQEQTAAIDDETKEKAQSSWEATKEQKQKEKVDQEVKEKTADVQAKMDNYLEARKIIDKNNEEYNSLVKTMTGKS